MYLRNQKFLVLGVSKSGFSAANYILDNGGECYFFEEMSGEKISESIMRLTERGARNITETVNEILPIIDVVIISPGVPINHEIAVKAKRLNIRIIGEFELGYLSFNPPFIAVTGTNGKTTTVNMISDILKAGKIPNKLVGNVGVPLTGVVGKENADEIFVSEISSFQLESIDYFCPHVACVLNISPDHLERHYTMENYIFLKRRILSCLTQSEYAVLNYDDENVRRFAENAKCRIIWISVRETVDGAYLKDGKIYYGDEFIVAETELPTQGLHNVYNALFAISCAKIFGVANERIISGLKNFRGVKHRMELVCEADGVKYFDDSKATNTASTITAIDCVASPKILIVGGSEKGENYDILFEKIRKTNVKHVVITGASKFNMLKSAGKVDYTDITITYDFENAVKIAAFLAESGDCVLLSPACASFDSFKNYEERGDFFAKTVRGLTC